MCIRDRPHVLRRAVDRLDADGAHGLAREPVSYTHLDVYKRQVVVSTAFCREVPDISRVARVVREFPQVPTVALLSQVDRGTARAVLTLGQCGIRTLVCLLYTSFLQRLEAAKRALTS